MSADFPVGVPFNIGSYALLTMMVAQCVNMVPGDFIHTFGDLHIYLDQIELFKEQLTRTPYNPPKVIIDKSIKNIFDFKPDHFQLTDYEHHPSINYPVAK